ncbi:MAG TPA: hypothetical protein VNE63_22525 [Candidatus Acidoferrales bacterium]|nr:hypothetical protein [Candidatus Acidoferrales bacterium]
MRNLLFLVLALLIIKPVLAQQAAPVLCHTETSPQGDSHPVCKVPSPNELNAALKPRPIIVFQYTPPPPAPPITIPSFDTKIFDSPLLHPDMPQPQRPLLNLAPQSNQPEVSDDPVSSVNSGSSGARSDWFSTNAEQNSVYVPPGGSGFPRGLAAGIQAAQARQLQRHKQQQNAELRKQNEEARAMLTKVLATLGETRELYSRDPQSISPELQNSYTSLREDACSLENELELRDPQVPLIDSASMSCR